MYHYMQFRFKTPAEAGAAFDGILDHPRRKAVPRRQFTLAVLELGDEGEDFVGISGFDVHRDGRGEFGWYLDSRFWNRGIATAASHLLLWLRFELLDLPVVTATCDPENGASRRVLEKCGLRLVGELREPKPTWRGPRPRLEFAGSREDWCATTTSVGA